MKIFSWIILFFNLFVDNSRYTILAPTTKIVLKLEREIFFIFNTFFKLFPNLRLFNFFFKTNTFARAYSHGAAKSFCRAMHGGVAGAINGCGDRWRGKSDAPPSRRDRLATPRITVRACRATHHGAADLLLLLALYFCCCACTQSLYGPMGWLW